MKAGDTVKIKTRPELYEIVELGGGSGLALMALLQPKIGDPVNRWVYCLLPDGTDALEVVTPGSLSDGVRQP